MADSAFCPNYHKAIELIGRRWAGAIIRALLPGRARYCELSEAIPDISDRMLAERLRELENEGIVSRTVVPSSPVRIEYELTEKGRALEESVSAIARWADRWVRPSGAPTNELASTRPSAPRPSEEPRRA
jgi:DNA-binding HxlR family transcriptional regulator